MKVALFYDQLGWAYDIIADEIIFGLSDIEFTKFTFEDTKRSDIKDVLKEYDVVHFLDWHFLTMIDYDGDNAMISIHSWRNRGGIDVAVDRAKAITVTDANMLEEFPDAELIENGVDRSLFFPGKKKVIGFAGKPDDYKGFPLVEQACEELGIDLRVAYYEKYTHDSMPHFYRSVDAIITPSIQEGFNMPVIEALACGIDVFTTPVGVANELDHIPQVHIIEREYEAIKRQLGLFCDPLGMGNYDWGYIAKQYKELYEDIASN